MADNSDHGHRGAIYLAFGYDYLIMTLESVRSLKDVHPDLDVTIVTNVPIRQPSASITREVYGVDGDLFDEIVCVDADTTVNRDYKTSINEYSPYDRTVFLDSDTVVRLPLDTGFNYLDYCDLAAVSRPLPSRAMIDRWDGDINVEGLPTEQVATFHSGVFFFRKGTTQPFFERWSQTFEEFGYDYDQFSFAHAIYESDVRFLPLISAWDINDTDIDRYRDFYDEVDIEDHLFVRHENLRTFDRIRRYRRLERTLGDHILDLDDDEKSAVRGDFQRRHSTTYELKRRLAKYATLRKLHEAFGRPFSSTRE